MATISSEENGLFLGMRRAKGFFWAAAADADAAAEGAAGALDFLLGFPDFGALLAALVLDLAMNVLRLQGCKDSVK
jgi:hypothetical protein